VNAADAAAAIVNAVAATLLLGAGSYLIGKAVQNKALGGGIFVLALGMLVSMRGCGWP
jgi:hypothetical protein